MHRRFKQTPTIYRWIARGRRAWDALMVGSASLVILPFHKAQRVLHSAGVFETNRWMRFSSLAAACLFGSALHIRVSPAALRRKALAFRSYNTWPYPFVQAGDWDRQAVDTMSQPKQVRVYHNLTQNLEAERAAGTRIFRIYENIAREGYRSQTELGLHRSDDTRICIGRDGELLFQSKGNHRLVVAQILDIPTIPATVAGVHTEWVVRQMEQHELNDPIAAIQRGLRDLAHGEPVRHG